MTRKEWLEEKIIVDEWGRPPSLADVPLTIMTRKDALIKRGGNTETINKLYKEVIKNGKEKEKQINLGTKNKSEAYGRLNLINEYEPDIKNGLDLNTLG